MTLDELFNNAKNGTQDAGYEENHVSHRKNGDFIKQGGTWVPMKGQKQEGAEKTEAGADEQTMRQSLINFMTKGAPHATEADAKKAVENLDPETLNQMFEGLKEQHGDKFLAKQESSGEKVDRLWNELQGRIKTLKKNGMSDDQIDNDPKIKSIQAEMKTVGQKQEETTKSKDDAYMDEQGLHDIYMDIKNNELEDYTVEEIAKEYKITKGDAEVIKNRIENNKRAKEQDKQDRSNATLASTFEAAKNNGWEETQMASGKLWG